MARGQCRTCLVLQAQLKEERDRYERLVNRVADLGLMPKDVARTPPEPDYKFPESVELALERLKLDPASVEYRETAQWVKDQLAMGVEQEAVAAQVARGWADQVALD